MPVQGLVAFERSLAESYVFETLSFGIGALFDRGVNRLVKVGPEGVMSYMLDGQSESLE